MIIGLLAILIGLYIAHSGAQAAFGLDYFNNPIVPLGLGAVLYVWVSAGYIRRGDLPMAWAWFMYSMANVGFIMKELK